MLLIGLALLAFAALYVRLCWPALWAMSEEDRL
jgi:hypothetical protein